MHLSRSCLLFLATGLSGCGAFWADDLEAGVRVRHSPRLSARVDGRLRVVEQAPGTGFVVRGGVRIPAQALAGFEAGGVASRAGVSATVVAPSSADLGQASVIAATAQGRAARGANATVAATRSSAGQASAGGARVAHVAGPSSASIPQAPAGGARVSGGVGSATTSGGASFGELDLSLELEAAAEVPRDGVWGLEGRPTAITAVIERGVQVDGIAVRLTDLEALAHLGLDASDASRMRTDGALEAWAELEHDTVAREGGESRVVVRMRAPERPSAQRAPIRVHLVIDRSSSMQRDWARVLGSARMLIERLAPQDELQIVAYGTEAMEAHAVARVGDGRAAIAALESIPVGGGTNIEAGLRLAYAADARARSSARGLVLLLSDGVPNHGGFEVGDLAPLAGQAAARGCSTSVIGLGMEFDARLLRGIARSGGGGYHVSADIAGLTASLGAEIEAHSRAAAHAVSLRVQMAEGVELLGLEEAAASGVETIEGGARLRLPHLDAGEERTVVLRVRIPRGARSRSVAGVTLDYRSAIGQRSVSASKDLAVSYGRRAILHGGATLDARLSGSLAQSLDRAGLAIRAGRAADAVAALEAHAVLDEGRVELASSPRLQMRVRVVRRLARAVGELVPGSSRPQRRQVFLAFGAAAERIGR